MKIFRKFSFRKKLFINLIIVGIIPLFFMVIFSYYSTSKLINGKINTYIVENLNITSKLIDTSMINFININDFIATNDEVKEILSKKEYENYEESFNDYQKIYKLTKGSLVNQKPDTPLYIIGTKNKYSRFGSNNVFPTLYMDVNGYFFKQIKNLDDKNTIYIHRRVDGSDSRDVVMALIRTINDQKNNELLGYVILDIYDDYFDEIFSNTKIYQGTNIYVLDKNGIIITDKLFKNKTGFKFYDDILEKVMSDKSGSFKCNIQGKNYVLYFNTLTNTQLKIVETIPVEYMYKDKKLIIITSFYLILLIGFLAIIVSFISARTISKPINKLSKMMNEVEKGNFQITFPVSSEDEIGKLGMSFNKMVKEINKLIDEVYIKQYLLKESELKALKAQINPHFLYNTLESINWMAKLNDTEGVVLMVTTLGKFLRYSISKKGDIVKIREAIEQIKNYIIIQKVRYGDKLKFNIEVQDSIYEKDILKLLIQPLVENSIIHGLEPKLGKGTLTVRGYSINDNIIFEIIDDGVGFDTNKDIKCGLGIDNVRKRIKLHYGEKYDLTLERKDNLTIAKFNFSDNVEVKN